MGLLTRFIRRSTLRVMSVAFCTPELMPSQSERFYYQSSSARRSALMLNASDKGPSLKAVAEEDEEKATNPRNRNRNSNNNTEEEIVEDAEVVAEETRTRMIIRGVHGASVVFDLLDLINAILDLTFAVRLTRLPDATVYAVTVMVGLLLGRIVLFRTTWLLFHGGIQIDENLQNLLQEHGSPFLGKNVLVLQMLYCLAYAEAAAFMFENYPTLATCAFWRAINNPPSPLERVEQINIIMTVVLCLTLAFCLLSTTLGLTAWQGYLRLKYQCQSFGSKAYQLTSMALGGLFVAAVISFMWQITSLAWKVTILDEFHLPSGDLLWGWISLCEDVESPAERTSFCDERVFLIKTALAWMLACYFAYFLFFKAASSDSVLPPPLPTTTTATPAAPIDRKQKTNMASNPRDDTSTSNSATDWGYDSAVDAKQSQQTYVRSSTSDSRRNVPSIKLSLGSDRILTNSKDFSSDESSGEVQKGRQTKTKAISSGAPKELRRSSDSSTLAKDGEKPSTEFRARQSKMRSSQKTNVVMRDQRTENDRMFI